MYAWSNFLARYDKSAYLLENRPNVSSRRAKHSLSSLFAAPRADIFSAEFIAVIVVTSLSHRQVALLHDLDPTVTLLNGLTLTPQMAQY